MKPEDKYLNSIEFTNECYLEMREVARRAYLAGYKYGSLSRCHEGDVDIPVGHVKDVSVKAWLDSWGTNPSPVEIQYSRYMRNSLSYMRLLYMEWAKKEISAKRMAAELRKLGYYVENIGGRIQVDVWIGGDVEYGAEEDLKDLPF